MNLSQIKKQHPEYANIPDQELADKIYDKHYADKLNRGDYYNRIGFNPKLSSAEEVLDLYMGKNREEAPKTSVEQLKNIYGGFDVTATKGGLGISQLIANALAKEEGDFGHRWQNNIENSRLLNEEKIASLANSGEAQLGSFLANTIKSAPALFAGGAAAKGARALGSAFFPNAGPALQYGGGMLKNILGAGVFGAANEGMNVLPQNEERLPHMQKGAIDAAKYAALFEGLGLGAKALTAEYKLPTFMSQKKIGAQVGGDAKALANELSDVYEDVKTTAREAGIKANTKQTKTKTIETGILDPTTGKPITREVQISQSPSMKQISTELQGIDNSTQRNVHNALKTGDIGDLIDAEKALGQFKHREWMNQQRNLKAIDQNAYDAATIYENKINNYIEEALNKHNPTLADELFAARNKYHIELAPYKDVPAIREYMYGNLKEKDLVRLLQSNTKSGTQFRAKLADKYKAVGQNKLKNDLGKMGLKATRIGEILLILGKM